MRQRWTKRDYDRAVYHTRRTRITLYHPSPYGPSAREVARREPRPQREPGQGFWTSIMGRW